MDAGKSNRDKTQQDKKGEKEEAEADDGQGQDKINEQIDEVMRIQNQPALLTQGHATAAHSSWGVSGHFFPAYHLFSHCLIRECVTEPLNRT